MRKPESLTGPLTALQVQRTDLLLQIGARITRRQACAIALASYSFHQPTMPRADKAQIAIMAWRCQRTLWRK